MSIEKLFEQTRFQKKDNFEDAESLNYVKEHFIDKNRFQPDIDYSNPAEFAKYGSLFQHHSDSTSKCENKLPTGIDDDPCKFDEHTYKIFKIIV